MRSEPFPSPFHPSAHPSPVRKQLLRALAHSLDRRKVRRVFAVIDGQQGRDGEWAAELRSQLTALLAATEGQVRPYLGPYLGPYIASI